MRYLSFLAVVVLFVLSTPDTATAARNKWGVTFSWNTAGPTGRTGEYVDRYSFTGFGGEITYNLDEHNYLGLISGWQRFDVFYRDRLAVFDQGAVFGSQVRAVAAVPLLLTATHQMGDPIDAVRPFFKLGAGIYWMTPSLEMGVYRFAETSAHFGLMPSFGANFRLDRKSSFVVQLDYNAAFSSGQAILGESTNEESYIGLKFGFHFGS